jgi:hypothetical protein
MIITRRVIWAAHVACMREIINAYRMLVRKPEGKRPLGRPRRGGQYNIRLDHRGIWWKGEDWIHLAQDRGQWQALVNTVMGLRVP